MEWTHERLIGILAEMYYDRISDDFIANRIGWGGALDFDLFHRRVLSMVSA